MESRCGVQVCYQDSGILDSQTTGGDPYSQNPRLLESQNARIENSRSSQKPPGAARSHQEHTPVYQDSGILDSQTTGGDPYSQNPRLLESQNARIENSRSSQKPPGAARSHQDQLGNKSNDFSLVLAGKRLRGRRFFGCGSHSVRFAKKKALWLQSCGPPPHRSAATALFF